MTFPFVGGGPPISKLVFSLGWVDMKSRINPAKTAPILLVFLENGVSSYLVVSWNRGTPSHHPFLDGIFPSKPSIRGIPHLWKRPLSNWVEAPRSDWMPGQIGESPNSSHWISKETLCEDPRWSMWLMILVTSCNSSPLIVNGLSCLTSGWIRWFMANRTIVFIGFMNQFISGGPHIVGVQTRQSLEVVAFCEFGSTLVFPAGVNVLPVPWKAIPADDSWYGRIDFW